MNKPFWDTDRLKKLEELWVQPDLSTAAIARHLETTKGSILGKAHRIGLAERYPKRTRYSPQHTPPVTTFPVAGSEAPVRQPPKESGEWRGAPVPADLSEGDVMKLIASAERRPAKGVLTLKLKPHHCRWPVSEDGEPYRFCGEARVSGKYSFCEEHAKRAFYQWPPK